MATNEILTFAGTDTGTNLLTQAEYTADSQRLIGNQPGIARSKLVNKAMRQSTLISAAIAQYMANRQSVNVTDLKSVSELEAMLVNAIAAQINASLPETIPAGTVIYAATNTAPSGFIKANGAIVSRTTYAALFAAIGTTFGAGNGSTTFALPDLRAEFIRGLDDGRGVDAGRALGSWQDASASAQGQCGNTTTAANSEQSYSVYQGVASFGGIFGENSTYYRHRPRNVALLACIKY